MIANPRQGQPVPVWYAAQRRHWPRHSKGRGKPRNHGVRIGEKRYVVPCGNLRKATCNARK